MGTATIDTAANVFTDAVGNNNTASNLLTFTHDTRAPTITSVETSWGGYLNAEEDNSDGTVTVVINGVEDHNTVNVEMKSEFAQETHTVNGTVNNGVADVTVGASILQALIDGNSCTLTVKVSDAGKECSTRNHT